MGRMPSATEPKLLSLLLSELELENARPLDLGALPKGWGRRHAVRAAIEGEVAVQGRRVTVRICLDERFPRTLPSVLLSPPDAIGLLPHVDREGTICYAGSEGIDLDTARPAAIAKEALKRALQVLDDGLTGKNAGDVLEEFGAYWAEGATGAMRSLVEPSDSPREITALYVKGKPKALAADFAAFRAFQPSRDVSGATAQNALYVPLHSVKPQALLSAVSTPEGARSYIRAHLTEENLQRLDALRSRCKREELVLLGLRRPGQDFVLLGLRFAGCREEHPLHPDGYAESIHRFNLVRCDRQRLLTRGGASPALTSKRALVIGCGSVGGHVAVGLAWAGIGHLTLVDPDDLSTENTFRHVLGYRGLGQKKVDALKDEILSKLPHVTVDTLAAYADLEFEREALDPRKFDVVTVALGAPATERFLNERLWKLGGPPAVFCWLEPLGLGGHALLSAPGHGSGCYSCLYAAAGGDLHCSASFAAPGQTFSRDDVGCGGRFTPFSAANAVRTAELCVELATGCALGTVRAPVLRSWKGSPDAFLAQGYRVSPRFEVDQSRLTLSGSVLSEPSCPVCQ